MTPDARESAATLLAAHRRRRERLRALPDDLRPRTLADAYAVQDRLHAVLAAEAGPVAGHKIGCTTPVMQAYLGIDHPCAGGVFETTVVRGAARLPLRDYCRVGVECEIVVVLARDLDRLDRPCTPADVASAVAGCAVGIELVEDRYVDYRALDTATLVADDFFNAGIVIGVPVTDWRGLDLAACEGVTHVGGEMRGSGRGADVLGHPLAALAWLADHRAARGTPLRAGEFVSTGSVVQTQWIDDPCSVVATIEGLGSVEVNFV